MAEGSGGLVRRWADSLRRRLLAWRIARSGLFDATWYRARCATLRPGEDPIRHYLQHAPSEPVSPHPMFDAAWYLRQNPEVAQGGGNPLLHFLEVGAAEGRRPHPRFTAQDLLAAARAEPTDGLGRGPIAWMRRKNRARLQQRKARLAATAGPAVSPPVVTSGLALGVTPRGLVPATAQEAWGAYDRLHAELRRRRALRREGFRPIAPERIAAPEDLAELARTLALPAVEHPLASIVIPTLGRSRETLESVAAVAAHTHRIDYEVVVVVDGPSDATASLLADVPNVRQLRGEPQRGPRAASAFGASAARGEHLVFLTPGVQPTAGWLQPLLDTFESHERVGAVGPMILDAGGRLREAGRMLEPDLGTLRVGLGEDPSRARFNYAREVHCCSPECLVVPRRAFEQVGGFTEAEALTPDDDGCDLQLKLRQIGLRSICQPASRVLHRRAEDEPLGGAERRQLARSSQWLRDRWGDAVDAMHAVRLVAFYLPQFHPIPENDLWWGKGFTEWTNVAKALPLFPAHEQPHLPTELGFYDLRVPEIMRAQARLARAYGVSAFCFYYYWFHGKRLLEAPIERLLEDPAAEIPFCLCWANENWTRRWDGGEGHAELLLGQAHSDEDDEAVIRDLIRFLRHPGYLRVNGKPMLLVYRVELFPDIARTTALWREVCRREGVGELHLVRVDSFVNANRTAHPALDGFDATVEFPPHGLPTTRGHAEGIPEELSGKTSDYEDLVLGAAGFKDAGYLHYRCVLPRWDNSPRRGNRARIEVNSSPGAYQAYLEEVLDYTREQNVGDDRMVFVNAWNEWGEGAHLEPERRYGRAFLEATANALSAHLTEDADPS